MNDVAAAEELYNWFGLILERYNLPQGFSGTFYDADFDFFHLLATSYL